MNCDALVNDSIIFHATERLAAGVFVIQLRVKWIRGSGIVT